jgi:hypothetical protein
MTLRLSKGAYLITKSTLLTKTYQITNSGVSMLSYILQEKQSALETCLQLEMSQTLGANKVASWI